MPNPIIQGKTNTQTGGTTLKKWVLILADKDKRNKGCLGGSEARSPFVRTLKPVYGPVLN